MPGLKNDICYIIVSAKYNSFRYLEKSTVCINWFNTLQQNLETNVNSISSEHYQNALTNLKQSQFELKINFLLSLLSLFNELKCIQMNKQF